MMCTDYFSMDRLISLYYCCGTALIVIISLVPNNYLLLHGKSLNSKNRSLFEVPKRFFLHFYLTGFVSNLYIWMRQPSALHLYLTINIFRRLVETVFIMRYNESSMMHVLHYLAGMTFYPVTGALANRNDKRDPGLLFLLIFIMLSWLQLDTHSRLANIRRECSKHQRLPNSGLFSSILCPHYALEILIYVLIFSRMPSLQSTLCLLFVSANIFTSAHYTKKWYNGLFKDERCSIIPCIF